MLRGKAYIFSMSAAFKEANPPVPLNITGSRVHRS